MHFIVCVVDSWSVTCEDALFIPLAIATHTMCSKFTVPFAHIIIQYHLVSYLHFIDIDLAIIVGYKCHAT